MIIQSLFRGRVILRKQETGNTQKQDTTVLVIQHTLVHHATVTTTHTPTPAHTRTAATGDLE